MPPPESTKSRHSKPLKPPDEPKPIAEPAITNTVKIPDTEKWPTTISAPVFEDPTTAAVELAEEATKRSDESRSNSLENSTPLTSGAQFVDSFSDLDPLGTGKSRPYVDKKYFFQDLKNPPKKVLKDLSEKDSIFSANFTSLGGQSQITRDLNSADIFESNSINIGDITKTSDNANTNGAKSHEFTAHFPPTEPYSSNQSDAPTNDSTKSKADDPIIGNNRALLVTDNDPFSPRMKKFDPFNTDFVRAPMDPFEFSFTKKQTILPDTRIDDVKLDADKKASSVFNGPLQVSLPPESYSAYMNQKRLERQHTDSMESTVRNRPNVFKQNTVDVISSIKKPHLFGQKFSKRDSNSINMRRLQESDSLSENEAAPEPPPRPDSHSHVEPPPLPPKKQFQDIVIRPRVTSPLARESPKYDYLGLTKKSGGGSYGQLSNDTPALPLPSRRVGRTESSYPGPGRPAKKTSKDEDDYLTPINDRNDVPTLLPPPQTRGSIKNRIRRLDSTGHSQSASDAIAKAVTMDSECPRQTPPPPPQAPSIPDITLSQLLTLGIDDLASKLNVPVSKLNTMTIVQLTKYLSDFIEKSSQRSIPVACEPVPKVSAPAIKKASESAIFKVSFDDSSDATFTAKFDDNFGEDSGFVPDFDNFNEKPGSVETAVDRYAAFREIMAQEPKNEDDQQDEARASNGIYVHTDNIVGDLPEPTPVYNKIDTKITQAISNAKDRYAALRDIILVEDLFDKNTSYIPETTGFESAAEIIEPQGRTEIIGELDEEPRSSPEVNISINLEEDVDTERTKNDVTPNISQPILSYKDDLEIDEYMNRAISNLSLDSRDHLSPLSTKSPISKSQNASTSPIQIQVRATPECGAPLSLLDSTHKASLNDMSTSPIPIKSPASKSPLSRSPLNKSPLSKSPLSRSPIDVVTTPKSPALTDIAESHLESLLDTSAKVEKPSDATTDVAKGISYPFQLLLSF